MKDDTISRMAAVDALDRLEYTPGEWATNGLTMCKDAIKELSSAQPGQRWIPCSTALPEHDGEYLVTIKAFTIDQAVYADIDIARYTGGKWRKGFPVTAWQPLPTPYREGGQS